MTTSVQSKNKNQKKQVLDLIWEKPVLIGNWVGFKDLTELHNDWLRSFLWSQDDQTLLAHRGSYKTTVLSLFNAIHTVIRPNENIIMFRKTSTDVEEIMRQTIKILDSGCMHQIARILFDGVDFSIIKSTNDEITTTLQTGTRGVSQIVGKGIGTSITGKHADIVETDDIVNLSDRRSKAERESTKLHYMELQNIKNRGGRIINTATPWHPEDAVSMMPNVRMFDCYSTGLMTREEVEELRGKMTKSLFAANYELRHIASDDVIFDNPQTDGDPMMVMQAKQCHIDASYGGEDYTAFTICRKAEGKYWVYGRMWHKHVDSVEDEIIRLRQSFAAGKIYCEDNGDKGYLAKELRRKGERVVTYSEGMNKYIKITSYLKGEWKNVVFVKGTDDEYIRQITDYNEDAEHDDAPDSLASLIRLLWSKRGEDEKYDSPYLS